MYKIENLILVPSQKFPILDLQITDNIGIFLNGYPPPPKKVGVGEKKSL